MNYKKIKINNMENRWADFIYEMSSTNIEQLETLPFKLVKAWLTNWASYIKSGGVRPDRPH